MLAKGVPSSRRRATAAITELRSTGPDRGGPPGTLARWHAGTRGGRHAGTRALAGALVEPPNPRRFGSSRGADRTDGRVEGAGESGGVPPP